MLDSTFLRRDLDPKFLSSDDYEDNIPYQPALPSHRKTNDLGTTGKRVDRVKTFCKWHWMTFLG
ncbi:hypothetical protein BT96DRAFT_1010622 [Gymnopus androsaceus JB14]|uniref:Uncharacterized protein n=1 Tax=Gymnopus androsaceus JB14 TaxID=1447944 RepID=A0A6A4GAE4_9AGAR|nr:hypothetical protein BT96DRAFT_1010622 [Gymnopus androsaceus JB14]